jgi:hypothetical protein
MTPKEATPTPTPTPIPILAPELSPELDVAEGEADVEVNVKRDCDTETVSPFVALGLASQADPMAPRTEHIRCQPMYKKKIIDNGKTHSCPTLSCYLASPDS